MKLFTRFLVSCHAADSPVHLLKSFYNKEIMMPLLKNRLKI